MSAGQSPEISGVITLEKYQDLLQSFEDLELHVPENTEDYSNFLVINEKCIEKVHRLINEEENNSNPYFLALLQIKESLLEQRNLLLSLSYTETNSTHSQPETNYASTSSEVTKTDDCFQSVPNGTTLSDVVGLDNVKQLLIESIVYPTKYPQLFTGARKPWSIILLFGPPGTGKTSVANAIASEINAAFYNISSVDLLSKYIGESEKLIREFFTRIHQSQRQSIVLFDEIDALCKIRTSEEADHSRRIKTQLLTEFQNIISKNYKTMIICTTNCPWDIDTAFLRRFQRKIFVPLPCRESRKTILQKNIDLLNLSDNQWNVILNRTEGYSGSDLAVVTNFVLYEPLKDLENCQFWLMTIDGFYIPSTSTTPSAFNRSINQLPPDKIQLRNVSFDDFDKALSCISKSVQLTDLKKYENFI